MSHSYSWDSSGIYKDGRYLNMNDPKTRQALENDPYGQKALSGYRSGTSGKASAELDKVVAEANKKSNSGGSVSSDKPTKTIEQKSLSDIFYEAPSYKPLSEKEARSIAQNWANLQIDPQIQALQRAIENARTTANTQTAAINAAYAGIPAQADRMLADARNYALESAIARGGGRSGVVNWETEKRTTPIMQQAQQYEAEKAAKLAGVTDWLANAITQGEQRQLDLEGRRGDLTQQYIQDLMMHGEDRARANWQAVMNAGLALNAADQNAYQFDTSALLGLIPYILPSISESANWDANMINSFGQVPARMGGLSGLTPEQQNIIQQLIRVLGGGA